MGSWLHHAKLYAATAGLIIIFCMTGWWGVYRSKKGDDMLSPDMAWVYVLAHDL